jgi:hypothetical protein
MEGEDCLDKILMACQGSEPFWGYDFAVVVVDGAPERRGEPVKPGSGDENTARKILRGQILCHCVLQEGDIENRDLHTGPE